MEALRNPIAFPSITSLLAGVLQVVIIIAIPIVMAYLIYGGFLYVTARGNPDQIRKGSSALIYGLIGAVIIIGSVAILEIITNLVTEFKP